MEKPTDMEMVLFWMYHINNPCGVKHKGKYVHIRPFYIERAKELLKNYKFDNPFARELLEDKIKEYS